MRPRSGSLLIPVLLAGCLEAHPDWLGAASTDGPGSPTDASPTTTDTHGSDDATSDGAGTTSGATGSGGIDSTPGDSGATGSGDVDTTSAPTGSTTDAGDTATTATTSSSSIPTGDTATTGTGAACGTIDDGPECHGTWGCFWEAPPGEPGQCVPFQGDCTLILAQLPCDEMVECVWQGNQCVDA